MKRTSIRAAVGLCTLLAWPATASAGAASYAATASTGYSAKSRAILGGGPSRLEMIAAQQSGRSVPATLEPASLSIPSRLSAIAAYGPQPARLSWTGRPDIFGTVALSLRRTTLDREWRRVSNAGLGGVKSPVMSSLAGLDTFGKIAMINSYVNGQVRFVDDWRQYGRGDRWTSARETLQRRRGDCEDYAIAKMQLLRAAGIPSEDLFLVLVRDLVRRADHAVLVVRAGDRTLLLDNGTDKVFDTEAVRDYRPVLTFASTGTWTHGYRRAVDKPIMVAASATTAAVVGP